MPELLPLDLRPPARWQCWEDFCQVFYRHKHPDAIVQPSGRSGQKQHGVDVYVQFPHGNELIGIACRHVKKLKPAEIADEYEQSRGFMPPLTSFVMFTTAPRDTKAQCKAIELTQRGPYPCLLMSWDDIKDELWKMPQAIHQLYPELRIVKVHKIAGTTVEIDLLDGHLELLIAKIRGSGFNSTERLFIANRRNRKCVEMDASQGYSTDQLSKIMSPRKASQIARWLSSERDLDAFLDSDGKYVTYWVDESEEEE